MVIDMTRYNGGSGGTGQGAFSWLGFQDYFYSPCFPRRPGKLPPFNFNGLQYPLEVRTVFLQNFILIVDEGFNLKTLMIRRQLIKDFLHISFFFCVSR